MKPIKNQIIRQIFSPLGIWMFVFIILFTQCAGVKVRTVYNESIDFSQFQTFCWIEGCDIMYQGPNYNYDPEILEKVRSNIKNTLESKGLTNDPNNPDLLIGFHIVVQEQQIFTGNKSYFDAYDQTFDFWDDYTEIPDSDPFHKYLKGSLIIDVVEASTNTAIWQSTAIHYDELTSKMDEQKMKKAISKALSKFPPKK